MAYIKTGLVHKSMYIGSCAHLKTTQVTSKMFLKTCTIFVGVMADRTKKREAMSTEQPAMVDVSGSVVRSQVKA